MKVFYSFLFALSKVRPPFDPLIKRLLKFEWMFGGSLPNATFNSGKKSHMPSFALAKYLANACCGPKYLVTSIFLYLATILKTAVMKYFGPKMH